MAEIILFRFDREYDVCRQNLGALKKLNPELPVYGLYGGEDRLDQIPYNLSSLMQDIWAVPLDDPYYKWRNGDLCTRMWFREKGHSLSFDHLFLIDWDLYFTKPFSVVYPSLKKDCNYSAIWANYAEAKASNWNWVTGLSEKEIERLIRHLDKHNQTINFDDVVISWMGGTVFCRAFLEQYSQHPVPGYSNDELRLGVYSRVFDISLLDNTFLSDKNNSIIVKSRLDKETEDQNIRQAFQKGSSVIHPVRHLITEM